MVRIDKISSNISELREMYRMRVEGAMEQGTELVKLKILPTPRLFYTLHSANITLADGASSKKQYLSLLLTT